MGPPADNFTWPAKSASASSFGHIRKSRRGCRPQIEVSEGILWNQFLMSNEPVGPLQPAPDEACRGIIPFGVPPDPRIVFSGTFPRCSKLCPPPTNSNPPTITTVERVPAQPRRGTLTLGPRRLKVGNALRLHPVVRYRPRKTARIGQGHPKEQGLLQWANISLMTMTGTFVVNGTERVIRLADAPFRTRRVLRPRTRQDPMPSGQGYACFGRARDFPYRAPGSIIEIRRPRTIVFRRGHDRPARSSLPVTSPSLDVFARLRARRRGRPTPGRVSTRRSLQADQEAWPPCRSDRPPVRVSAAIPTISNDLKRRDKPAGRSLEACGKEAHRGAAAGRPASQ